MEKGELQVTGKDHIEIQLQGRPDETRVHFTGQEVLTPCNPQRVDSLSSLVVQRGNQFFLVIKWDVSDLRDIKWEADY